MKNFIDKFVIILALFLFSCNNNYQIHIEKISNKLEVFNNIKDSLMKNLKRNKVFYKDEIKSKIDIKKYKVLNDLKIDKISKINNTLIFSFKIPYKQTWIERRNNSKIKFYNIFLFYGKNKIEKSIVMNYEQFSECQLKKENIDKNWTYIIQKWYCSD